MSYESAQRACKAHDKQSAAQRQQWEQEQRLQSLMRLIVLALLQCAGYSICCWWSHQQ
jgi:hypothetical protein